MICISIRQPWAWLIVHGYKPVENRTWPTSIRGDVLIHAAKGMTMAELEAAYEFIASRRIQIPETPVPSQLQRGGIIGRAKLVDCVRRSDSPWFVGPFGHVFTDPKPLPFQPLKGMLGYFHVEPGAFVPPGDELALV